MDEQKHQLSTFKNINHSLSGGGNEQKIIID